MPVQDFKSILLSVNQYNIYGRFIPVAVLQDPLMYLLTVEFEFRQVTSIIFFRSYDSSPIHFIIFCSYSSRRIYAGFVLAADNIVIEEVSRATKNTARLPANKVIHPMEI
jgi:hypothetical protein